MTEDLYLVVRVGSLALALALAARIAESLPVVVVSDAGSRDVNKKEERVTSWA